MLWTYVVETRVEVCRLRAEIDKMLTGDRMLSLVVAIETALEDKRFEVQLLRLSRHRASYRCHLCHEL